MSTYYTAPPTVVDGDVAYAADVNDLNAAASSAFDLVEGAITDLPDTVTFWADKAEDWAEKAEDSQVESGKYSAKHHAAKASASATSASGSANTAVASAGVAVASAGTSSTQAGIATTQASTATIQAGIATTKATLATDYAQKAEDSQVESGTYSAYHWSKKAEAFGVTGVLTLTGTGVDNTDPRNPVISLDKTSVGLTNVDNTSDANKPVSTAQQTALNLKANLASPTLTGVPVAPTATVGTNTTQIATTEYVLKYSPIITPSVRIEGGIIGGDIFYNHTGITVYPFSCVSHDGVQLSKSTNTGFSVSPSPSSGLYWVYAVKLVSDGSITCKYHEDPSSITSDATVSAYRLLGVGFESEDYYAAIGMQYGDTVYLEAGADTHRRVIRSSISTAFTTYNIFSSSSYEKYFKSLDILVTNTATGYLSVNYDSYLEHTVPYTTTNTRNKITVRPTQYINCKYTTANCGLILAGYTLRR